MRSHNGYSQCDTLILLSQVRRDRFSGDLKRTATSEDLIFGSNTELRAEAELYARKEGADNIVQDFVAAWTKVMQLDHFDI